MVRNESDPQVDVASDEDWKNRVKSEDAALDQQFRRPPEVGTQPDAAKQPESRVAEPEPPTSAAIGDLPAPTFSMLVGMLSTQAMVALGVIPNPATGKAEQQLPVARHFIDLLSVVEQKTSGNRTPAESGQLDETLHQLRIAYIQLSQETD